MNARRIVLGCAVVSLFALVVRLAALPYATTETGDATTRVWTAWEWLGNPVLITHEARGPLHFYMAALVLWLFEDPVYPPILLNVALSAATACLVCLFTAREFGNLHAALIAGLAFACYPIAVRNSLMALSETPFVFFIALALLFLSRARRAGGNAADAVIAGLLLTLACMLRYEGWMLIPFMAVLLWPHQRSILLFTAFALLHPVFWMIGNGVHYGDPLYGFHRPAYWELVAMGKDELELTVAERIKRFLVLPVRVLQGLTPVVAVLCALGALYCVVKRARQAAWLVPPLALLLLLSGAAARGSLVTNLRYTETFGLFLLPFLAVPLNHLQQTARSTAFRTGLSLALIGSMLLFSIPAVWRSLPVVSRVSAIGLVPSFRHQELAKPLPALLRSQIKAPTDGFITDHYGWQPTYYVALRTRLHPDRIFDAPGAPNIALDVAALKAFVERFPRGVLLLHAGSRFAEALHVDPSGAAVFDGMELALHEVTAMPWPELGDPRLRGAVTRTSDTELIVFRYELRSPSS